jgi:hypothetical protein
MATLVLVMVGPVAAPAWALEWSIRHLGFPRFQFAVKNSIPYFVPLVLTATWLTAFVNQPILAYLGLTLLTELEGVALAVAVGTAMPKRSQYRWFLGRVARRQPGLSYGKASSAPVIAALVSLSFTTWFFGTATALLHRQGLVKLDGPISGKSGYDLWWTSLYYSFSTITTMGSTITPVNAFAQAMAMAEVSAGILFFVFIIAVLTGRLNDTGQ